MGKQTNDVSGRMFGWLKVLKRDGTDNFGYATWLCQCKCGGLKIVRGSHLLHGKVVSCGCKPSFLRIDLVGRVFGRLTVLEEARRVRHHQARWKCRCSCGNIICVDGSSLRDKNTKSCGCLRHENRYGHGLSYHPLKGVWKDMKRRCYSSKCRAYKDYGARGISVCEEWEKSFISFYEWAISNGWEKGLRLDRKDNDGIYEPSNCRFITHQKNCQNTRLLSSRNCTGFRGVSLYKPTDRYRAAYTYKGKLHHVGYYKSPEQAARARDLAVIEAGVDLPLNFPELKNDS